MNPTRHLASLVLTSGLATGLAGAPLFAATFCVGTSAELAGALIVAELNNTPDQIRIKSGNYSTLSADGFVYAPADAGDDSDLLSLTISGGWDSDCSRRAKSAFDTTLDGLYSGPVLTLDVPSNDGSASIYLDGFRVRQGSTYDDIPDLGAVEIQTCCSFGPFVEVTRVVFEDNFGFAALHVVSGQQIRVLGSLFSHNWTSRAGGASVVVEQHDALNTTYFLNNTVVDNIVSGDGYVGGFRFEDHDRSDHHIVNNIFWNNDNVDMLFVTYAEPVAYNDYGVAGGSFGGVMNLQADPQFNNPSARDYRLRHGSPMIDSGNNLENHLPTTDLIGTTRPQLAYDRGAYEFMPIVFLDDFETGNTGRWSATVP